MNVSVLLIAIFIQITCVCGFLPVFIKIKKRLSLSLCIQTCFADDDDYYDDEIQRKINVTNVNNYIPTSIDPLYTLLWYDCNECEELLEKLKSVYKKIIYINGSYYFYDLNSKEKGKPLLYKEDEFVSDEIFEIYEELFRFE